MKHPPLDLSLRLVSQLFCESAVDASSAATMALVVLEGRRVYLGLIMELQAGAIRKATDLNSLPIELPLSLSAESFERLWHTLSQSLQLPAAALLCDRATFEGLVNATNKLSYLAAVGHAQPYFYRVEMN